MAQIQRVSRVFTHSQRLIHSTSASHQTSTKMVGEYSLLKQLLGSEAQSQSEPLRAKQYAKIIKQYLHPHDHFKEEKQRTIKQFSVSERPQKVSLSSPLGDDLDARVKAISAAPGVSAKDIQVFIDINSSTSPEGYMSEDRRALLKSLIANSSPTSLRALMLYMQRIWSLSGLPSLKTSHELVLAVLSAATKIHKPTTYIANNGQAVEQVGIADMKNFDSFYRAFKAAYAKFGQELTAKQNMQITNLQLELLCRCSTLTAAQDQLVTLMDSGNKLDRSAVSAYLDLLGDNLQIRRDLSEHDPRSFLQTVRGDLDLVKDICASVRVVPAQIKFQLSVLTTNSDEFFELLDKIDQSSQSVQVYEACQREILNAAFKVFPSETVRERLFAVACWFSIMERVQRSAPIYAATWNDLLLRCAKFGNAPGVLRILSLYSGPEGTSGNVLEKHLNSGVVGELLDHFPLPQFPGNSETDMDKVLATLKPFVTPQLLGKYITALLRGGSAAAFRNEWESIASELKSPEAFMAFISGFMSLEMPVMAIEALKQGFKTDARLELLHDVLHQEVLPESFIYRAVAESAAKAMWSEQDLEQAVGHIPGAVQAIAHQDQGHIDELWPRLSND